MRKPSVTDALLSLLVVAGMVATVGFVISAPALGGAALGVGLILMAALVRSVARDLGRSQTRILAAIAEDGGRTKKLEKSTQLLASKVDAVVKGQRESVRAVRAHGDRIERRTDSMTRRILGDISAARLEAADRQAQRVD